MTRNPDHACDLAVIGAGSGGMAAARRAADAGMRVVLFEAAHVGGTCVNAGCVPKKLMVHASRMADALAEMPRLGWCTGPATFDWPLLRDAVQDELARLARSHASRLEGLGVEFVRGHARIAAPDAVEVEGQGAWRAERILVATGAAPVVPDIPGAERCLTSDDLFILERLPERMAIVGGGYIAVEFACLLRRLGVAVTLFERGPRLIAPFDAEIAERLRAAMVEQGIDVRLGATVDAVEARGHGHILRGRGTKAEVFDAVLMAVGRRPNTDDLGLEPVGAELTERGHVVVDGDGRTAVPSIHAAGDVAERIALTPVAVRGARRAVDLMLGAERPLPRPTLVPTAAFTTPECASVGVTEDEARARSIPHDVRRTAFRPLAALVSGTGRDVFMKAIVERGTERMLGFHFFGAHASEAAQLGAVALSAGLTAGELSRTMALHPSIAEEVLGLGQPDEPLHQQVRAPRRASVGRAA